MKRLPKFKSEEEEARFWDTHSPLDYRSEFVDVKEPFEFAPSLLKKAAERREERKRTLTLRMGQRQEELANLKEDWQIEILSLNKGINDLEFNVNNTTLLKISCSRHS